MTKEKGTGPGRKDSIRATTDHQPKSAAKVRQLFLSALCLLKEQEMMNAFVKVRPIQSAEANDSARVTSHHFNPLHSIPMG
ncbi:hypothetical protein M513_01846 [Trichuris suis]|uniref:Uncharacterized protein n=1 Tax=Trichuris suis TaxID=68888 RepID=A0A085MJD9_9BILA|nr:hypothetical protein M513_01846 [Trichuris suis]